MVERYFAIRTGSHLTYSLDFENIHTLEGVKKTLQSILDDLPKPEIDPEVQTYINEEGINIIFEEDLHLENW